MQDKQDKGIGRYRDRPGYFMGGMIGGAILGALVNKIQGKDWKKGAMWGGIGGGIMGGWTGKGGIMGGMGKYTGKSPWMGRIWDYAAGHPKETSTAVGLGTAYLAGDPEYDKRKIREDKERRLREQMARNRQFYPNWYTNPWTGDEMRNTGGMINARKRYYNGGGSATLEYTDPDLYAPTGEGGGPSSNPILQIPLGPEESFADEFEDLDLAGGPSGSDMSGWHEMYEDLKGKGELPDWMDSFEIFMQNLDVLDISPWDFSARGGYKTRPGYADAGPVDRELTERELLEQKLGMIYNHPKVKAGGERMLEELDMMGLTQGDPETVNRKADYMLSQLNAEPSDDWVRGEGDNFYEDKIIRNEYGNNDFVAGHARDIEGNIVPYMSSDPTSKQWYQDPNAQFLSPPPDDYNTGGRVKMVGGGIGDLDMTGGGASFGPGTGTSDDIPAMLSDGEFVVTANAVQNLGGGDRMLGARRMYQMMNQLDPNSQTPAEMNTVGIA